MGNDKCPLLGKCSQPITAAVFTKDCERDLRNLGATNLKAVTSQAIVHKLQVHRPAYMPIKFVLLSVHITVSLLTQPIAQLTKGVFLLRPASMRPYKSNDVNDTESRGKNRNSGRREKLLNQKWDKLQQYQLCTPKYFKITCKISLLFQSYRWIFACIAIIKVHL